MAQVREINYKAMARAMVMVSRYSADITEIAQQSLGRGDVENRDIELLLVVCTSGPTTPTGLAARVDTSPSVVSRALRRLEEAGLVARARDETDRRIVTVTVSAKGRRRVATFSKRLEGYFVSGEPLVKDMLHTLGLPTHRATGEVTEPLAAAADMARAGDAFVTDVAHALAPFAVGSFADRFALVLIFLNGHQRPSQIADELGFSLSGTSGLVTRLEAAGLITRRHDVTAGDRRAVRLELTRRGEQAVHTQLSTFARHAPDLAAALRLTWRQ